MPDDNQISKRKVILGTGITKMEFIVNEQEESFEYPHRDESPFASPFGPNQFPDISYSHRVPIYSLNDWKLFLGEILQQQGLPNDLRQVIWTEKNTWSEIPVEIKNTYQKAFDFKDIDQPTSFKLWSDWVTNFYEKNKIEPCWICDTESATKEDTFVISDSKGGYAARLLKLLPGETLIKRIVEGKFWEPEIDVLSLFQCGIKFGLLYAEANAKFKFEELYLRGEKSKIGQDKAAKNALMSEVDKKATAEKYRQYYKTLEEKYPNKKITWIKGQIAKNFSVSAKTVHRYLKLLDKN